MIGCLEWRGMAWHGLRVYYGFDMLLYLVIHLEAVLIYVLEIFIELF